MTANERSGISNAIWLCQTHAALIDRDSTTFTEQALRDIKRTHETRVSAQLTGINPSIPASDLVALGPDLVFVGELIGTKDTEWQVRLDYFFIGELASLIAYIERFDRVAPSDRYVLINSLGDGRQLSAAPVWRKTDVGYVVTCLVRQSFPRTNAHDLRADIALDANHDLSDKEPFKMVSGLAALPQKIKVCLSIRRGEMMYQPKFGTRIQEYFDLFRDSTWLAHLIKLEVVREACVPFIDFVLKEEHTPLQSVLLVREVGMLPGDPVDNWLPFRFKLVVEGVGPWECDIPVFVSQKEVSASRMISGARRSE